MAPRALSGIGEATLLIGLLLLSTCSSVSTSAAHAPQRPRGDNPFKHQMSAIRREPIVHNATEKQTGTLILLHGLSDQGDGWSDIGPQLLASMPYVKFIFPNAPMMNITMSEGNPMPAWFNVFSLLKIEGAEDEAGMLLSRRYVEGLVAAEMASAGVPSERVVVAGFSQGGAVALMMLESDVKLAGVVAMGTWLPKPAQKQHVSATNAATPVLYCHGTDDQVVFYKYGQKSVARLKAEGTSVDFKTYPGLGHNANPQMLADVAAFAKQRLPRI